jgi:hypothetical protein
MGEHRRLLIGGAVALVALAAIALGPASNFLENIDDVQESSGRLSSPVFPGEALGIWPEGDFRLVRGDVDGSLLASAFAGLCALGAAIALVRRREWALLSALGAAAFVYALSRPFAQIHVEAKALAVLAPIVMLVTLKWLLGPDERSRAGVARLALGSLFAALALASTFLALRAAPVGFDERQRNLEALAERVGPDDDLVFLGVDRFAGYYLRGTLARSPGGYVPAEIGARTSKTWQQGQALDFDTLEPKKLNRQEYAITTTTPYASAPPLNWEAVAIEGDYVLWRRHEKGPDYEVLPEEDGHPGALYSCADEQGEAVVFTEPPVVGEQDAWAPGFEMEAPGSVTQIVDVPEGPKALSLQYHSQVPLTLYANGEEVGELPPSLEGFYLTGAGRGAFWFVGDVNTPDGPLEIEVESAEPSGLQDLLGVPRRTWVGDVALVGHRAGALPLETRPFVTRERDLADACGEYLDHYLPAP